jgi:hypothetical protein
MTEITALNPIIYNSGENTITYNCFSANGIEGSKSYEIFIKLSEDTGFVVYGPYTIDVLYSSTPVFVNYF